MQNNMLTQRYFTKDQERVELDFIETQYRTDKVFPYGSEGYESALLGSVDVETRLAALVIRLEARVRFLEEMMQKENSRRAKENSPLWSKVARLLPEPLGTKVWTYFWSRSMAKKAVKYMRETGRL